MSHFEPMDNDELDDNICFKFMPDDSHYHTPKKELRHHDIKQKINTVQRKINNVREQPGLNNRN